MSRSRGRTTKHRSPRSLRVLKPRGIDLAFYWDRRRPHSPETLHTLGEHKPAETPPWGLGRLLKTARQVLVTQSVGLTPAEVSAAVWWVADGERLPGHRAVTRVLRELGGSWGIVGRVIAVPPLSWLGGPVYRWVATNRARF